MYYPLKEEFIKLSLKGNLIPVYLEVSSDLETPVSAFLKIKKNNRYACLLESVEGEEKIARFSFVAVEPRAIIAINEKKLSISQRNHRGKSTYYKSIKSVFSSDPISEIKEFMSNFKPVNVLGLERFFGGLIGYMGYDIVRFFENIPDKNKKKTGIPDSILLLTDTILIFDHYRHKLKIVSCAYLKNKSRKTSSKAYSQAITKINRLNKALKAPLAACVSKVTKKSTLKYLTSKKRFSRMIEKAKRYIKKGDIIQVVLSQVLSCKIQETPFDIYRKLRSLNPSAYMFYLALGDLHLVGSSPEMLVRSENGVVTTRPIAGTRPRGITQGQDKKLEKDLLNDIKERAEHVMLVDLGRNDLGRVCKFGTVRVTEFMRIERYSHVMHIVSEVQGILKQGKDAYDLLRAAFPAGTVTGSPKVRAMQIIDELEDYKRGPYAGCVGYFSFTGNLDICITIRTIIVKNKTAYIQAGAGIVADSKANREYQETLNKARAQLEAL